MSTSAESTVPLGTPFTLGVGESAMIADTELRVSYQELVEDSRCPPEVTCVWEGDAVVGVKLAGPDSAEPEAVELHTYDNLPGHADYAGYRVELVELSADAGRVTLVVTR